MNRVISNVQRIAVAGLLAGLALTAGAHPVIERNEASVVAVGTLTRTRVPPFKFLGTGFAVGDGRLIATDAHVVAGALESDPEPEVLAIVLPSRDAPAVRALEVSRIATDDEHDFAILRLASGALPPLALRADGAVSDGDEFLFTGFPIGAALGPIPATHRAMASAVRPIAMPPPNRGELLDPRLVRRLQRGAFPVYQLLDGTAYPGSSSPVYDPKSGEVVALINMVPVKGLKENALAQPSGITYAIPIGHLRELLEQTR
jgi:S1-C subfamily serine protease